MMANMPADGWDRDEREALKGLEPELDALRARHARDPEIELLRAAEAEVLPDDLQSAGAKYLAHDRWSRTLVEGLNDDSVSLDRAGRSRELLDRIRREAARIRPRRARSWSWLWPSLVAAAAGIIAVVWVMRPGVTPERRRRRIAGRRRDAASRAGLRHGAREARGEAEHRRPDVAQRRSSGRSRSRISSRDWMRSAATTMRRPGDALGKLTAKYPMAIEVFFYLWRVAAVPRRASGRLRQPRPPRWRLADTAEPWFGADAAWYLAIADERLGRKDAARTASDVALCRGDERTRGRPRVSAAAAIK